MSLFIFIEVLIIKGMTAKPKDNCDYIIILGCQIRGDHITRSLKNRLDVTVSYAIDNPDTTIIVSGGGEKVKIQQKHLQCIIIWCLKG